MVIFFVFFVWCSFGNVYWYLEDEWVGEVLLVYFIGLLV